MDSKAARAALREALAYWDEVDDRKSKFIADNEDPNGNEPKCGYEDWDMSIADANEELASAGDELADAVRDYFNSTKQGS
ncbi:hypothetical protein SEA_OCTOBIEN14_135 [Gordonia phage Octobien14]|uniref:Uncharacterized protein n=1 Tax=Gordonia phage Octobien14 TaxID=2483673 RepID=A0A3G3M9T2_9CAUD|nr:hypothetical protein L3Y22_gp109 [Gordonia phage Octobien14]AYR03270.1 hypothetical protein SEA_OCTOBIEN14_135 [Gordonia phage Octobien14]